MTKIEIKKLILICLKLLRMNIKNRHTAKKVRYYGCIKTDNQRLQLRAYIE